MTNGEAARVRACLWCGSHGAWLCKTTQGANPGRLLRVCGACLRAGRWGDYRLVEREPLPEEMPPAGEGGG